MRLLLLAPLLLLAGCVSRTVHDNRALAAYRYCVVPTAEAHGDAAVARHYLAPVFEVVKEKDPRLADPEFQKQTCVVAVDYFHGLWRCSGTVDVRPYDVDREDTLYGEHLVLSVECVNGCLYLGAHQALRKALADAVEARTWAQAHPEAQ